jgi:hypothetical protein
LWASAGSCGYEGTQGSDWVRQLAEALRRDHVAVWLDVWQIHAGDSLSDAIEAGLRNSDAIVAVLSRSNARRPNTFFELGLALGMGKRLIPIIAQDLEAAAIPFDIRARRYLRRGAPEAAAREVAAALRGEELGA